MDDKAKLRLLNFWKEYPEMVGDSPDDDFASQDDIVELLGEMGNPTSKNMFNHAEKIRNKIKTEMEIESIEVNKKVIEQQTKYNRIIALTGCVIAVATLFAFSVDYQKYFSQIPNPSSTLFFTGALAIILLALLLGLEIGNLYIDQIKKITFHSFKTASSSAPNPHKKRNVKTNSSS